MVVEQAEKSNFLQSFKQIYYACKLFGIYPQDFQQYYMHKVLQPSKVGSCVVVAVMIIIFFFFNLMLYTMSNAEHFQMSSNNLDLILVIAFTYIGPATMITDQVTALWHQARLAKLFESIDEADASLFKLGIDIDNAPVRLFIQILTGLTFICEVFIFSSTYMLQVDRSEWTAILWIFACLPTLYCSLDKIWFLGILMGVKIRFDAINRALVATAEAHDKLLKQQQQRPKVQKQQKQQQHQYLLQPRPRKLKDDVISSRQENFVGLAISYITYDGLAEQFQSTEQPTKAALQSPPLEDIFGDGLSDFNATRKRFVSLCQLHDGICTIAKTLNEHWSYPTLALMAYSFVMFTAQLYFYYCSTQEQNIPLIFRSTKETTTTILCLLYIGGRCILLMFYSWKTSLASRYTGICLHKCGLAADTNEIYEIVNHLSLKLFNHAVNFSACGFFTLDMNTLFAVCGAITSYLIILVQFNMAGQQVKDSRSANITRGNEVLDLNGEDNGTISLTDLMFVPQKGP